METDVTKRFLVLFDELGHCTEIEQKQKIKKMNRLIDEMDKKELRFTFTLEYFETIDKMIEEKKLTFDNAILLMKHIGYWIALINMTVYGFFTSSLCKRIQEMIIIEEKLKEGKNESLLVDLCECYLLINDVKSSELLSICVPCLMKVALRKEDSKDIQEEVEMALISINNINEYKFIEKELFLSNVTEIFQNYQEHRNLTRLAYQSAWQFLVFRLWCHGNLRDVIVNELHFAREATRELEELIECVDWKRKEDEMSKEEAKAASIAKRWLATLAFFFQSFILMNEEFILLICRIVEVFRVAKDNCREICNRCIDSVIYAAGNRAMKVEYLLKSGAVDIILKEMQHQTLNANMGYNYCLFFYFVLRRLKEEEKEEIVKVKRNAARMETFGKMEEEGYEDCIIGLLLLNAEEMIRDGYLITNVEDLFVRP
ncbi:uncharacterized protein MONOS_17328 [Monocercomonoides exilis]|uniref:uncharacterized protein n=1 Tax=Monocercomonoides exilis TaxID=2049356 RepID=UPI003559AE08|nr:hypothetical protein MONOS_17328 [Monocercomonoides exilis]